ncbi:sugar ABC transporter permease [Paenibacillus sp. DXFW5]|uniref:Sugar ABC transporter permease n=1 Tax=Paenibacillus rhizolycopersici TaxID=2780073 RepID=A0ABS2H5Y7_9BACL|nr:MULTISPECIES: ABC transporter permease subunit [Paenibacillus]MBM6996228.1 sugar ABC transporter permease [Paenibacillus rhizolycopersici]MUG85084.1 ABC transporter permease subunit [Paenibacillus timonensis]
MDETLTKERVVPKAKKRKKQQITWSLVKSQRQLIFMSVPLLAYIILFAYYPVWGWTMAFQNYKPARSFAQQEWIGFKQFKFLFTDDSFLRVLRNTVAMGFINLVLGFITAIILALLLNEIKKIFWKRTVQTISYLPHFLSWIIVTGIVATSLASDGIINDVLMKLHLIKEPILWLSEGKYFWGVVGASHVWKEVGWNTIIYLAAMAAIDPALYEAADIDGASRYRKMFHVTLPGIKPTIVILLIMSIGHILEAGFEVQYLLGNGLVVDWAETIDIFVLKYGIAQGNYSLATAGGIFKTVVSITMLLLANWMAKRLGEERLL